MNLHDAISNFLLSCEADGLSRATIRWYRSLLVCFLSDFQDHQIEQITASMIRQYIVSLQNRTVRYAGAAQKPQQEGGLSEASIAAHVRALHALWGWCVREYEIPNPMANIRRQKNPTPSPKSIAPDDFVRLFNVTGDNPVGKRDRAILCFLADTGCRIGGLLALLINDLVMDQRRAYVVEKGDTRRAVVFTTYTAQVLEQWLAVRESSATTVFVSMTTGDPLTNSGAAQILRRLKDRAGVTGRVNPHSFRHNFAREYLRNGGDLATLAALLGHSDISTTAAYYAVFSHDELAEFHEKFSPLRGMIEGGG